MIFIYLQNVNDEALRLKYVSLAKLFWWWKFYPARVEFRLALNFLNLVYLHFWMIFDWLQCFDFHFFLLFQVSRINTIYMFFFS